YIELYELNTKEKINIRNLNIPSSPWKGKTLIVNGDSIPAGYLETGGIASWAVYMANELGMNLKNYAIGGSTIGVNPNDPESRNPIINRYQDMDDDGDLVIIAGGTNDATYSWQPIGDMTSRENTTFYGALHNLCLGLLDKYLG